MRKIPMKFPQHPGVWAFVYNGVMLINLCGRLDGVVMIVPVS